MDDYKIECSALELYAICLHACERMRRCKWKYKDAESFARHLKTMLAIMKEGESVHLIVKR